MNMKYGITCTSTHELRAFGKIKFKSEVNSIEIAGIRFLAG